MHRTWPLLAEVLRYGGAVRIVVWVPTTVELPETVLLVQGENNGRHPLPPVRGSAESSSGPASRRQLSHSQAHVSAPPLGHVVAVVEVHPQLIVFGVTDDLICM